MVMREQLSLVLATSPHRYVHPFGCRNTYGFGADFLGLLTTLMACLNLEIGFSLTPPKRPQGFVIKYGWDDYFEPLFEMVDAPLIHYLNIPRLPLQPQLPVLRPFASAWLRAFSRPRARYFWFDNIAARGTSRVPPLFSDCGNWLRARSELMKLIWLYNESTRQEIEQVRSEIDLPDYYHSVCIRRGDKNTEAEYVPMDKYVNFIRGSSTPDVPLFATSDDYQCIEDLKQALPERTIFSLTKPVATGYVHKHFKSLTPEERKSQTCRFLAQLECLWNADLFIGSNTTNVGLMVNSYRAGENVVWVD